MAPQPGIHLALCTLLAATALAARAQTSGKRRCGHAGDAHLDRRWWTPEFSYEGPMGPDFWPQLFPACGGDAQSPVDVIRRDVRGVKFRSSLIVPDFEWRAFEVKVINTGTTVRLEPTNRPSMKYSTLQGGPLLGEYELQEMNFHWGESDDKGSEHAIDGEYFAMEMHMVFKRQTTRHEDKGSSETHGDLAIIVIFFKVSSRDCMPLAPVVETLRAVVPVGERAWVRQSMGTAGLVPCVCTGVLFYNGSLTAPPCTEHVTWLIFPRPVVISSEQVAEFRKLRSATGFLTSNRRPVQPMNDRFVYTSRSEPAFRLPAGPASVLLLVGALSLCCVLSS